MEMDMRRLALRSALLNIIEDRWNESDILSCLEQLHSLYQDVEDARHMRRNRIATGWTDEAIEQLQLRQVGNFAVTEKRNDKERRIIFTNEANVSIEFIFSPKKLSAAETLEPMIRLTDAVNDPAEKNEVAAALLKSLVIQKLTGTHITPGELLLGAAQSALSGYLLSKVVRKTPRKMFSWLFGPTVTVLLGSKQAAAIS